MPVDMGSWYSENYALQLVAQGRLTKSRAAELLDLSVWDILELAQERGIELGATDEQVEQARKTAERLFARKAPGTEG